MKNKTIKRSFVLGDEWIYFKFYTGAKTADKILEEAVKPFTEHLLKTNKVDKWFFIRYADPESHLRVRLHYSKKSHVGIIIQTVYKHIEKFVAQELIWKVQTDTYQREIERYGIDTIELSEQLFFHESNLIINTLPLLKNPNGETQRWIFALKLIAELLDCFKFNLEDKLLLMESLKEGFGSEFGMNRFLKSQLDDKFRKERILIENSLNSSMENECIISNLISNIKIYKEAITPISEKILEFSSNNNLEIPIGSLIGSYIHMAMNRIFRSKQRVHELLLYDFLFRYYKSTTAREKSAEKRLLELDSNKKSIPI